MSSSIVVTLIRLYPLHCTLYTHTHTSASTGTSRSLSRPRKWYFRSQFLRCALHWLQLRKLLKLPISLRNPTNFFVSFFLLEVDRSYHNTQFRTRLFYCSYFVTFLAQFSTLGSAHRFLYQLLPFNPVFTFLFFVSYFDLQTFFSCSNPISPYVFPCTTLL